MPASLDDWFVHVTLVHEQALSGYLRRCWPQREWHDVRQEIYVRVYEAACKARPSMPKSFLFATARHLLTDRLRRSRVVSIEAAGDLESLHVLVDELSPERWCGGRQVLGWQAAAFDRLPDRGRSVIWLRRVEELSQKEVAVRLGISEKTVEKHVAKGMRLARSRWTCADSAPTTPWCWSTAAASPTSRCRSRAAATSPTSPTSRWA